MSDYHLHLHPHTPMPGAPPMGAYPPGHIERYVEVAASRGVAELGFTEHLYRCVEAEPVLGRWWEHDLDTAMASELEVIISEERNLSLNDYVEEVLAAKDRGLPVKLGLEVDFQPGTEDAVAELLAPYPFDFLIGAVHWIGAWSFDRRRFVGEFERRGIRRAYEQYFAVEAQLAASGMVDVLAHVDVIKKTGMRPDENFTELYPPVVEAAARSGTAVEVSSAGLRREAAEIFPAPGFLKEFNAAGIPITLASDAHLPAQSAWGHREVVAAARAAGYSHHLRFTARQPESVPLPNLTERG